MQTSHSTELSQLFESLAKAQGKIENALKDKKNPFFKSSYADLSSVWDACREPLSANGLSVIQTVEGTKEEMFLITWLGHCSGQWMRSRLPLIIMKQDPQSLGSAITYARRYALSALVGICADEDDDGEKAMLRKGEKQTPIQNIEDTKEKINDRKREIRKIIGKDNDNLIKDYINVLKTSYPNKTEEEFFLRESIDKFVESFELWKNKQLSAA